MCLYTPQEAGQYASQVRDNVPEAVEHMKSAASFLRESDFVLEQEITEQLADRVAEENHFNVVVILGEFEDPLLPDETIDLVFLCNTYHHIENRVDYFSDLKTDLKSDGRVVVIDMKDDLTGILRLFATAPHWTPKQLLLNEMEQAGYRHQSGFDFLPVQNFEVFAVN